MCVHIYIYRYILSLVSSLTLHSRPLPFAPSPLPKNPTLSLTNLHTIWLQWLHSALLVTCNFGITAKPIRVDSSNLLLKTEIYKHVIAKNKQAFWEIKIYIFLNELYIMSICFPNRVFNGLIMPFNLSFLFRCKGSKFQNWHTINTGATDHFLLAAQKAELDFSQAGIPKVAFH